MTPPWHPITNGSTLKLLEGPYLHAFLEDYVRAKQCGSLTSGHFPKETALPRLASEQKGHEGS